VLALLSLGSSPAWVGGFCCFFGVVFLCYSLLDASSCGAGHLRRGGGFPLSVSMVVLHLPPRVLPCCCVCFPGSMLPLQFPFHPLKSRSSRLTNMVSTRFKLFQDDCTDVSFFISLLFTRPFNARLQVWRPPRSPRRQVSGIFPLLDAPPPPPQGKLSGFLRRPRIFGSSSSLPHPEIVLPCALLLNFLATAPSTGLLRFCYYPLCSLS